jgi:hypothetical protein
MSNDEMPPFGVWAVHAARVTITLLKRFKEVVQKSADHCNEVKFMSMATDSIVTFVSHNSQQRQPFTRAIQEACSLYHVRWSLEVVSALTAELTIENFHDHLLRPEYEAFFASAACLKEIPWFNEARHAYYALIRRPVD